MRTNRHANPKQRDGQSKKDEGRNSTPGKTTYESMEGILERISDGFVALDNEMNYIYVNERGGDLLGRKPVELIGKNLWQEYPEAEGTSFANAYLRALKTQVSIQFEDYYEPWGRWFENRIYPSKDGLSVFFRDITERKKTKETLRESEERYRTIYETSGVSIWEEDFFEVKSFLDELKSQGVTDFRRYFEEHPEIVLKAIQMLKIVDVNEMTLRLYGAKDKNELLKSFATIQGPTNLETFKEEFISLAKGETYFEGEVMDQTLQGETLYLWRTIVFPKETTRFKSV
ncbi:MAG TPA: PAS domain-containing protein, partial [Anaerolineales bacterium]|nr:PAS domain-containing protein [Anaerolineales bacterium]